MSKLNQSFLKEEMDRPLCVLRRKLQAILDSASISLSTPKSPIKSTEPNEQVNSPENIKKAIIESVEKDINTMWDDLDKSLPGVFSFEKSEIKRAVDWVKGTETKKPSSLEQPGSQAVWGFGLLLNNFLGHPRDEKTILKENKRLIEEKNLMASLLLGTIKNKKTTIAWGKTGSWFYNDPIANHINIDPGQALLLGLQNSRSVLLHEIGHSQVTGDRSPKMLEIKKEIDRLCPEIKKGLRKLPATQEDRIKVAKLSREYSLRENFWQYAEDACVNTYAEIEGSNFTNNIPAAMMRVYTVTLLGREHKKWMEDSLKSESTKKNPLKGLEDLLDKTPKSKESEKEKEVMQEIEERLKAAAASYPISRGWIDTNSDEEWELIGSKNNETIKDLYQKLSRPMNSFSIESGMPIGAVLPSLVAKRFELISETTVNKITKECIENRNNLIDETFDEFIKPLIEMLPDPPAPEPNGSYPSPDGEDGEMGQGGQGEQEEKQKNPNGEKDGEGQEQKGQKEGGKEGDKGGGKNNDQDGKNKEPKGGGEKGRKIENTVEDKTSTLEEAKKAAEEAKEKEDAENKRKAEEQLKATAEAIRNSMGSRSPLECLPTGCGSYDEAAEALKPQIAAVVTILKKIALKQKTPKLGEKEVLPDPIHGINSFDLESFVERKKKELSGDPISSEDRRHFRHEDKTAKKPTTTHLAFYIDGSGSMSGSQAERTMLTLIIFNEASKRVPEIQVSAVYSGADKTIRLLSGSKLNPTEQKLVADILQSGFASGDNEISPGGLADMNEEIGKSIPKSGAFGMTHTIFLTDGWSYGNESKAIATAIKTTLDGNPLSTFDTFILNGGAGGAFIEASSLVKTKREGQTPTITQCQEVNDICPAIVKTLLSRIRSFKSFEPKPIQLTKTNVKKNIKKLRQQEEEITSMNS